VGCSHDTASFAVESIRRWWREMGQPLYPQAEKVLVCADSGGSNGYRIRLWKVELQRWANETGLDVTVCHYPPGTSKWNKIEHRLFSHITMNWRGRPLVSYTLRGEEWHVCPAGMNRHNLRLGSKLQRHHGQRPCGSSPSRTKT
jgi:hypothetical protein